MREINPDKTRRAEAFSLWMQAKVPMVTLFKTLDDSAYEDFRKTGI